MQHAILLDGMVAGLFRDDAVRDLPEFLCVFAVLRISHSHVGRQAVGKRADLAGGAAGRRLAGQREGAVARLGDFTGQEMDVVDHLVGPDAADVLVEAHSPERHDLDLGVGIKLGQLFKECFVDTCKLGYLVERVFGNVLLEGFEIDRRHLGRLGRTGRLDFQRVFGAQAITDVGRRLHELGVLVDEFLVDATGLDDVVGDVVEDRQIRAGLEDQRNVGKVHAAMGEGR
ncbi:hypothetical protein D3C73_752350 [compost metagenome]